MVVLVGNSSNLRSYEETNVKGKECQQKRSRHFDASC